MINLLKLVAHKLSKIDAVRCIKTKRGNNTCTSYRGGDDEDLIYDAGQLPERRNFRTFDTSMKSLEQV